MDSCPCVDALLLKRIHSVCPTLVLASASPNRRRLLEEAGVHVITRPQDIWEICGLTEPPEVVKTLSRQKFDSYISSSSFQSDLPAVAVDTLVSLDGKLLGKPQNRDEAIIMLKNLSGKWHEVYSGMCVYNPKDKSSTVVSEVSKVHFIDMDENMLNWYLETDDWVAAAGAYKIQANGYKLIDQICGSYSNIIGLPLEKLVEILG